MGETVGAEDAGLEGAWAALRRAGDALGSSDPVAADLTEPASRLGDAAGHLLDAIDGRGDRDGAILEAMRLLDEVRSWAAARTAVPSSSQVVEHVSLARIHLADVQVRPRPPRPGDDGPPPLVASVGTPALHHVRRRTLKPVFDVPPAPRSEIVPGRSGPAGATPPRPTSFAELREVTARLREQRRSAFVPPSPRATALAPPPRDVPPRSEVPPGYAHDACLEPEAPIAFLEQRTREMVEEVAMVAMQRTPSTGEGFRAVEPLEQRMLRALDAIASIGPVAVAAVPRLFRDAPARDAPHAFALAFILGCLAGRDALAAVEAALFHRDRTPEILAGIADGLALASHDRLDGALRAWLTESDGAVRAIAIDVLHRRARITPAELLRFAADDDPRVAAPAVLGLSLVEDGASARGDLAPTVARARDAADRALRLAGHVAATIAQLPHATAELRSLAESGGGGAAAWIWCGIAGDEHDAAWLLAGAQKAPTPAGVAALGWAGAGPSAPALVGLLEHEDEAVCVAAAAALERITGAGLREEVELDDDLLDVPDPPAPALDAPRRPRLATLVSTPRTAPPAPARETALVPTTDPGRWSSWLEAQGARFTAGRYRVGEPHGPHVVHRELDLLPRSPADRRLLQLELVLRTARHVPLDPRDLVATQDAALRAWAPLARAAASAPGRWSLPVRRR